MADSPLPPTLASVPIQMGYNLGLPDDELELKRLAGGSAFLLETRSGQVFLVTARHCVTGKDNNTGKYLSPKRELAPTHIAMRLPRTGKTAEQFSASAARESYVTVVLPLFDRTGAPTWFEHESERVDVVAIPLRRPSQDDDVSWSLHAYPPEMWTTPSLDDWARPTVNAGTAVSVIGFPLGFTAHEGLPIWTHATVASDSAIAPGVAGTFLIDAATTSGNSGSPVIYHRDHGVTRMQRRDGSTYQQALTEPVTRLLGVYSSRLRSSYSEKETTIGVVWSSSIVEMVIPLPHGSGPPRRPKASNTTTGTEEDLLREELDAMDSVTFDSHVFNEKPHVLPNSAPLGVPGHHVGARRLTGGSPPSALWRRRVL